MLISFSVKVGEVTSGVKEFFLDGSNGEKFPLACVGRYSYIIGGGDASKIASGADLTLHNGYAAHNLQIGQFSSIAYNVTFTLGLGHNYYNLSTGKSDLFPDNNIIDYEGNYREKGQILIQNDVWLGHHVTIMPGVVIHNGAVVAAGSHVVKDVPPYAIVGGNPAKIIKYRFSEEIIEKLLTIQWWNWESEKIKNNAHFFNNQNLIEFCDQFYEEALGNNPKMESVEELPQLKHTYLFFADFTEPYSIWERVISEFIRRFKFDKERLLIIHIPKSFADENQYIVDMLSQSIYMLLEEEQSVCTVSIYIGTEGSEKAIFQKANYFITNRCKRTILHSEYAYQNRVKIISGVDIPIF